MLMIPIGTDGSQHIDVIGKEMWKKILVALNLFKEKVRYTVERNYNVVQYNIRLHIQIQ